MAQFIPNYKPKIMDTNNTTQDRELFTGGDWRISEEGNDIEAFYSEDDKTGICQMYAYEKADNDMRLLKEAKNMYEALRAMYELAEDMGMLMTSTEWSEKFRNKFNPIMTNTETILTRITNKK